MYSVQSVYSKCIYSFLYTILNKESCVLPIVLRGEINKWLRNIPPLRRDKPGLRNIPPPPLEKLLRGPVFPREGKFSGFGKD